MREDRERILRYWWMLELFNPQSVPTPTGWAGRPGDEQVIEWRPGKPLPWELLRPPRPKGKRRRAWRHTVYLGVYDLKEVYQYLHRAFAEDPDAYDEPSAGVSACAAVLLDGRGRLMTDTAVLSSALWAVGQIGSRGAVPGPDWMQGLAAAQKDFRERLDVLDGRRRALAGAEEALPLDAPCLPQLVGACHGVAGVAGTAGLASERITIRSKVVYEGRADDVENDFLNSFFLEDLTSVQMSLARWGCPPALSAYLTPDAALRTGGRVDVLADDAATDAGVRVDRLPRGRWPSDPGHPLALRQQFAVNEALRDLSGSRGLMGVNGPPGTGKTTMLREVLAGNVVERARRLASLDDPSQAFTEHRFRWTSSDGYDRVIPQLREELTGFEMVVASANNTAVENITLEVPAREAIADRWRQEADYFADIASATLAVSKKDRDEEGPEERKCPQAWGIVAARLGRRGNRAEFWDAFWFDSTRVTWNYQGMQTRLQRWEDGTVPHRSWGTARAEFRLAERRVDDLLARRQAAQTRLDRLEAACRAQADLGQRAQSLAAQAGAAGEDHRAAMALVEQAAAECAEANRSRDRVIEVRPGVIETLLSLGRAARDWRARLEPVELQLTTAQTRWREARAVAQRLEQRVRELSAQAAEAEARQKRAAAEAAGLQTQVEADQQALGPAHPRERSTREAREMRAPWLDPVLDEARSELFLAALRLHEDFLANTAGKMVCRLRGAVEVVAGEHPRDLKPEALRAAWQMFFLVVPMISTTFASLGRMFAGLGPESLGWLFIDEAGQAPPQYAVGAIWRAQRVIAVGDPLQLQPVVTMPSKARHDIAAAFGVSAEWIPPGASVQSLADRVSCHGTTLTRGEHQVWVSAPLTVHRRCDEPMFGLCNDLAYGGMMVSGVHRRLDDPEHPDLFDGPEGPRLLPSRWLDEPATRPGTHLQTGQVERLRRGLDWLGAQGVEMSEVIAISPFRAVARSLNALERRYPGLRAGTIHTAQGREADVVFLVLGGDPNKPGAKAWASQTVNLVNVAASRARRRLYVIGDQRAWAGYTYFDELAARLGPEGGAGRGRLGGQERGAGRSAGTREVSGQVT